MANILALAGPNSIFKLPQVRPAGPLVGFWHGSILGISFFISFFYSQVRIYETHNCGFAYDSGFFVGVMSYFIIGMNLHGFR